MKRTILIVGLCALALQVSFAETNGPEYSYIRLGYTEETLQGRVFEDEIVSGTAVDFSMNTGGPWAVIASHYSTDEGRGWVYTPAGFFLPVNISQEFTSAGALYHHPLLEQTDFLASMEIGKWKYWFLDDGIVNFSNNQDEDGYRISVGAKSRFFDSLEAGLLLRQFNFMDPDDFTEDTITDTVLEGNYYFLEDFHLGGSFIKNDHSDRFVVHIGYSFN